jgi:hypothetical protein
MYIMYVLRECADELIDEKASQSRYSSVERNVEIFIELALIQFENIWKRGIP